MGRGRKITARDYDDNRAVQPEKEDIHYLRIELSKYAGVKEEGQLKPYLELFKKVLGKKLIKHRVEIDEKFICVYAYFRGTEMRWRCLRVEGKPLSGEGDRVDEETKTESDFLDSL